MPIDWFQPETHALLVQYCRHVSVAGQLAEAINAFDTARLQTKDGLRHYARLLALQSRESAAMASLASKLRISPSSRRAPWAAATATNGAKGSRPWDD